MAVPKRKMSRSNTRSRRSAWKAQLPQVQKKVVNGRVTWVVPHRAAVVTDSQGTELFREYNNRRVADA
ncbi:MAG: 50S ribosomal protein L32 [Jiangellales bacterium]